MRTFKPPHPEHSMVSEDELRRGTQAVPAANGNTGANEVNGEARTEVPYVNGAANGV